MKQHMPDFPMSLPLENRINKIIYYFNDSRKFLTKESLEKLPRCSYFPPHSPNIQLSLVFFFFFSSHKVEFGGADVEVFKSKSYPI